MDLQFESLLPEEALTSKARVIITSKDEAAFFDKRRNNGHCKSDETETVSAFDSVLIDTDLDKFPTLTKAKILRSMSGTCVDDNLVIGIDPGKRIGISVIYLDREIVSVVESSADSAVEQISALLGGTESRKKVVKIGDGDIAMARYIARIIKTKFDDKVQVEIVDEHGTSHPQNTDTNRRGARDRSSARAIAFRTGRNFELRRYC